MIDIHPLNSVELCKQVAAAHNGVCVLSFSCGKDSIAAWLQLRQHFDHIVPYYMYLVPGLEFVEQSLVYYEDVFDCEILRLPQPGFYSMVREFLFQPPERCAVIEELNIPRFSKDDITDIVKELAGIPAETFTAVGVRSADSINRMAAIRQHGPWNEARKQFYPIYDWKKDQLLETIAESGIKLPVDYRMFGRSFDGLDYRFVEPIKRYYPRDYARILEWFPLADIDLARMTYRNDYYART